MADTKITALTALTGADPANDVIPIVDVSDTTMAASGTTKKISVNNILGASGTATLASATITGALTVGTGANAAVLKASFLGGYSVFENSAGTGNPSITFNNDLDTGIRAPSANTLVFDAGGFEQYRIASSGVFTWYDGAGGTRMTLNSTGLGVGGSPNDKLEVVGSGSAGIRVSRAGVLSQYTTLSAGATGPSLDASSAIGALTFGIGGSTKMTLDSSGQVGIGVAPSAWSSGLRAINFSTNGVLYANGGNSAFFGNNYYNDAGGTNRYLTNNVSTAYGQVSGAHQWFTAPSGTAGNAITFTQAMTLDASGYLLIGTTDTAFTSGAGYKFGPGATPSSGQVGASSSNGDLTYRLYSTGAAAYRFYVGFGGTVFATNTTISAISDARLKENVQDIDVGLGAILALKPRKFDWKAGKGKDIKGDRGFIAQEFEQVFPQLVDQWADEAPEGEAPYKSVRQDLIPVLVKAIQELAAEVNALKNA